MKFSVFLLAIFTALFSFSQNRIPQKMILSGTVYGYSFDPSVKLLNKENSKLEGSIGGVTVTLYKGSSKIASTKSSGNGTFSIEVPMDKDLKLEYSKDNYVTGSFSIDLSSVPDDMNQTGLIFENVELAMNSFVSDKTKDGRPFGKLTYNASSRALAFTEITYEDKKKLFGDNKDNTPLSLMQKSIKKNIDNNSTAAVVATNETVNTNQTTTTNKTNKTNPQSTPGDTENVNTQPQAKKINTLAQLNLENLTGADLETRQQEIDAAWKQLEQDKLLAITPEDFAMIQAREELLLAAEKELEDAKKFIALQEEEIAAQNFKIFLLVILLLVLAASAFFIFRYAKQKAQLNKELEAKNKKITESIHYALRIQQSVLLTEKQVQQLLPESFIYHKPLDIVSGDFYWVSEVDSKIILAIADCTGHGVPGAFMSLIGNTLMNHIVNEKKITNAGEILDKLHEGIIYSLRQSESEKNNQDGMDLSLVVIDKKSKTVQFAGAMNPIYVVEKNQVQVIEPTLKAIGGIELRKKVLASSFASTTLNFEKGASIYLTTDGYMDQFGGTDQSKFNLPKFKSLLLSLEDKPMSMQKSEFEKTFDIWKGTNKQTDDVLVTGFRI